MLESCYLFWIRCVPLGEVTCKMETIVPTAEGWDEHWWKAPGQCLLLTIGPWCQLWSFSFLLKGKFWFLGLRSLPLLLYSTQCSQMHLQTVLLWCYYHCSYYLVKKKRKFTGLPWLWNQIQISPCGIQRVFYNLTRSPGFDWPSILPLLRALWVVATKLMSTLGILINLNSSTFWEMLL